MFGKKKDNKKALQSSEALQSAHITYIPDVFYGGQDPEIYHHKINTLDTESQKGVQLQRVMKQSRGSNRELAKNIFKNRNFWIVSSVVFVLAVGGITWYYIVQFRQMQLQTSVTSDTKNPTENTSPVTSTTEISTIVSTSTIVTTSLESDLIIPTTTPSLGSVFIEFPALVVANTSDIDSDELTDIEEELFKTDSGSWDTDGDGYYDGQEVQNLYNPQGIAPVKLIDSGTILDYRNTAGRYRVYYPVGWETGSVDTQGNQVLFSSISGDYIEIRVFEKEQTMDFVTWFGRNAEGQRFTDLLPLRNRFGVEGWRRKDNLVAYVVSSQQVYAFVYHPRDRGPVAYRHIIQMMYQSFRLQSTDQELPEQQPFVSISPTNSTTTSSSIQNITSPGSETNF